MRYTEYYNQPAPELGETADITVVTNAILAGEKNQSGRVESIKATYSGNLITLNSETRQSKLTKYYNGLSFTFLSPLRLEKNDTKYQIKVDNLTAQPFKVKTAVNIGELVTVIFDSTNGFISANSPIPRSSATDSDSEETVATSRAVKSLKDSINSTNITAGKGLTGGGKLGNNISIDIATANDGIIVNDNNIQLNTVNNLTDASATKPLSAGQGKILNEKKFDKSGGTVSGALTVTGGIVGNSTLTVSGLLTANDVYLTSDKRLKTNIEQIANPVDKIKELNGYKFEWIDGGDKSGGVIAQELLPIIPEFVTEVNGYYRVNYNGLIGLLIETNKELIRRIEELEGKVR